MYVYAKYKEQLCQEGIPNALKINVCFNLTLPVLTSKKPRELP